MNAVTATFTKILEDFKKFIEDRTSLMVYYDVKETKPPEKTALSLRYLGANSIETHSNNFISGIFDFRLSVTTNLYSQESIADIMNAESTVVSKLFPDGVCVMNQGAFSDLGEIIIPQGNINYKVSYTIVWTTDRSDFTEGNKYNKYWNLKFNVTRVK